MSRKEVIGVKPLQKKALNASNNPSDINAVATMADVLAGSGGNRIITGSASYSGSGLTYDITALTYIIQGTLYASLATQVTLAAADPTDPRIDVILVDTLGAVSVLTGTPAPVPSKPTVDNLTEVEITFVSVPAGATSPPIVIETIYDEDLGSGSGEWDATTDGTVLLASVADPYQGTVSIETNPTLGPNKKISLMPGAPYTINGGQLSFWLQAKSDMTSSSDAFYIGFFNSGVLEGNAVTIAGSPAISFGFDPSIVGSYQLVTIPIAAFGGLSATIDELRFFKLGGASTSEFFLDDIQIEEGIPTPPTPIEGHEVYDEATALTQRPKIRFLGAGVTATDNPSENATDVTVPGGGGSTADSSTGLLTGGVLSVGTGGPGVATTFSISDGTGKIVDNLGAETPVSWSGLVDESLTFLATNLITFIGINSAGSIIQQTSPFTPLQSRTIIVLGVIVHVNFTTVDTVNNEQHITYNVMSSLYDAMESVGFFNIKGNIFSANGVNLNIDKSVGDMFKMGSNYDLDINNPHVRNLAAYTVAPFQYRFNDGTSGTLGITAIDPDNLDDGAGGLTAVNNNQWSIQRIYVFTSNNVKIQRGVAEYPSLEAAVAGISTENYITEPSIAANGLLRGWLIVKKGATALNGVDAQFLSAPKFGEGNAGATGAIVDLQTAYDNSIANPEVLTNTANGAMTVRRGSAADTDNIYEGQNNAGTTNFAVTGEGKVSGTDFNGVPLTTAGVATKYLDEQGNYTTPAGGGTAKFNMNTYAYNYVGASTTAGNEWNSVSVGAVGATEWDDRWRVASFVGTGGADGFYINLKLPSTYIAGTNIRVIMPFSTLTGGAGNAHIGCGLAQPIGAGGGFGSETETEWLTQQVAMLAAAAVTDVTFTFDGTTLSPGDDLSVMVYRDPGNAQDTLNDTIYNPVILIEEV